MKTVAYSGQIIEDESQRYKFKQKKLSHDCATTLALNDDY